MTNDLLATREEAILAEFDALPDVDAKYQHLFVLGERMPPMDPSLKTDANLVSGCQSKLWFHLDCTNGCLQLAADSDSLVIKGISAMLIRIVNGCHPEEIKDLRLDFIDRLDIWKLPSKRNNSLLAMLEHLKHAAQACIETDTSKGKAKHA